MDRRRAWEACRAPMPADLGGRRGEGGHGDGSQEHWVAKRNFGWTRCGKICVKHPISALFLAKNEEICVEWMFLHSYGWEIPGQARNEGGRHVMRR